MRQNRKSQKERQHGVQLENTNSNPTACSIKQEYTRMMFIYTTNAATLSGEVGVVRNDEIF